MIFQLWECVQPFSGGGRVKVGREPEETNPARGRFALRHVPKGSAAWEGRGRHSREVGRSAEDHPAADEL